MRARSANPPTLPPLSVEGKLTRIVGLTLEAIGCSAAIGTRCGVMNPDGSSIEAEVVGFAGERLYLMPTESIQGLVPGARVLPKSRVYRVPVDDSLLGRILDGRGEPLDGRGELLASATYPLQGEPLNPLKRSPIRETLDVGIRSINALLSVGRGQRLGLFAGSGVGKSVLLGMMTRYTQADVVVVGLIGERGREVKEFVEDILGASGMQRAVVVAAPADTSPLMRLHGAMLTHSIAEYFRDNGRKVLLLMDSLTRFAQAQREIGLAIGEVPATKGYPPSVFARLPQLVERAGNGEHNAGSITAFYTVLVEGDDQNDPIADAARAILDGHIVLSREIAESGQYPAIDVQASVSRAMPAIAGAQQLQWVAEFRRMQALYQSNRDLISVGAYQAGANPQLDAAVQHHPALQVFLAQDMHDSQDLSGSVQQLGQLVGRFHLPANTGTGQPGE
ncbi:MAG: flagellar protein export ATPase FliI [Gammaproteobacteria bacterium]|nr:flagellar protein export ATPase FliI [Gammaproteobacteria bacterium]